MLVEVYSLRAKCGYKRPLKEFYVPKMEPSKASQACWSQICCSILKRICRMLKYGKYDSSFKFRQFFNNYVGKTLHSEFVILTEAFIILSWCILSNEALKYFLNHAKTSKKLLCLMLTHYDDLQLQFQYHKNGFTLIMTSFDFDSFCNFGSFLMDLKDIKEKWCQIETHQSIFWRLFYANFQYGMILSASLSEPLNHHKN